MTVKFYSTISLRSRKPTWSQDLAIKNGSNANYSTSKLKCVTDEKNSAKYDSYVFVLKRTTGCIRQAAQCCSVHRVSLNQRSCSMPGPVTT